MRSFTSTLTIRFLHTPGGTGADEQGDFDFDAEYELLSVEADFRDPRCALCGDPSLPVPSPPSGATGSTLMDLQAALEYETQKSNHVMCDACAAKEEIAQAGPHETILKRLGLTLPNHEAVITVRGRLLYDCSTSYEGDTDCDVTFEPPADSSFEVIVSAGRRSMSLKEAVDRACQERGLADAVAWVAAWEASRVTGLAENGSWKSVFEAVLESWAKRDWSEGGGQPTVMRWGDEVSICLDGKLMFEIAPEVDPDEAERLARSFLPGKATR